MYFTLSLFYLIINPPPPPHHTHIVIFLLPSLNVHQHHPPYYIHLLLHIQTMKTVISKPGQLLKLLALAVLGVVLLNGAKSILFPCPSFKIVRSSDKSALPRPLSISPDSSDSVKTWYTLLTIEERGLTGYGAEVVAEEEAKEEKLAVKRDKAAVNQGKEAKPDSVKYTCSDQLLGKPGTVFAAKCGHECDLLTCKNLLADRTAGSEFTKKLLEQVITSPIHHRTHEYAL